MAAEIKIVEIIEKVNVDEPKQEDWNSLWNIQPFQHYNERIEELEDKIRELQDIIELLKKHRHFEDGKPGVIF